MLPGSFEARLHQRDVVGRDMLISKALSQALQGKAIVWVLCQIRFKHLHNQPIYLKSSRRQLSPDTS